MKTFKEYSELYEARRATHDVKQYLSHRSKPYEFWLSKRYDYPFPISGPMLERLRIAEKVTAFHILPTHHLDKLLSIVRSAKSISWPFIFADSMNVSLIAQLKDLSL